MLSPSRLLSVLLVGLLVSQAQATALGVALEDEECGLAMLDIVGDLQWEGSAPDAYYSAACQNPNAVVTLYANMYTYCKARNLQPSIDIADKWCIMYGLVPLLPQSKVAANLTPEAIAALPMYNQTHFPEGTNLTEAFLVDKAWFDITMQSEHDWDLQQRIKADYTFALYGFWGVVLVFGMAQNVVHKVAERRRGYVYADVERHGPVGGKKSVLSTWKGFVNKYIATPSMLPPYHSKGFMGCTIPTRAATFVVASYWISNLVLGAVRYDGFYGNIFWKYTASQIWDYLSQRTGGQSYANMTLLWMFSGRNNVFLLLTGWSFSTFSIFHRHVARIATLQAIIHSIGFTCYYITDGGVAAYQEDMKTLWLGMGVAATVIMSFIIILSISYIRRVMYENFLIVHIVFSVLLIVFLYYHTNIYDPDMYNYPFLITCAAIWAFDRLVRLVRQLYVNLHVRRHRGKGLRFTTSTVTYHADAHVLAIDVVPANTRLFCGPGQHYFLYQPLRFFGWQNHPFTLARWTPPSKDDDDLHLHFWVRPNKGWTQTLQKQCQKGSDCHSSGDGTAKLRTQLLLEGPYGACEPVHCYEQVLLVAGGSGIAGVLPYLQDYVQRVDAADRSSRIPTRTRHITLVWAERHEAFIHLMVDGPLAPLLERPEMTVSLHCTSAIRTPGPDNYTSTPTSAPSSTDAVGTHLATTTTAINEDKLSSGGDDDLARTTPTVLNAPTASGTEATETKALARPYHIQKGRPSVLATVQKMAQSIHGTSDRLAVLVCGPAGLSDDMRVVVSQSMEPTRDSIAFFEEMFKW